MADYHDNPNSYQDSNEPLPPSYKHAGIALIITAVIWFLLQGDTWQQVIAHTFELSIFYLFVLVLTSNLSR